MDDRAIRARLFAIIRRNGANGPVSILTSGCAFYFSI
jgi:hypothetical protein